MKVYINNFLVTLISLLPHHSAFWHVSYNIVGSYNVLFSLFLEKRPPVSTKLRAHLKEVKSGHLKVKLEPKKRKICTFCSYKKRRMTKSRCAVCLKHICGEHKVEICVKCSRD